MTNLTNLILQRSIEVAIHDENEYQANKPPEDDDDDDEEDEWAWFGTIANVPMKLSLTKGMKIC